jgi:RND family efflux transporter MFP subunit
MRRLLSSPVIPFAGLLVAILLVGACTRHASTAETNKTALTVSLVAPFSTAWPDLITASGSVAPWQESIIGAEVNGLKLEEVLVNVGDAVHQGQVLARFNDETTRAILAQVEATVAMAEANFALAHDQADRNRRLADTGAVSHETLLQYEASEKTSAAQLASAQAQLTSQRLSLQHTQVLAPDNGLISARSATVGAVLGNGAEMFRMIRQSRLEWRAEVPADQIARVTPGQEVALRPAGYPPLSGRVRQVAPKVDGGTGSGMVYVDLPEPGTLKAGVYAAGDIRLSESPALHVPESALVYRDGYTYVMKVDTGHMVHQGRVATGRRQGTSVEIIQGVTTADQLVASGGSFLNDGDTVLVAPAGATTPSISASPRGGS